MAIGPISRISGERVYMITDRHLKGFPRLDIVLEYIHFLGVLLLLL